VALRHSAARDPRGARYIDRALFTLMSGAPGQSCRDRDRADGREFDLLAYLARNAASMYHRTILVKSGTRLRNETHYCGLPSRLPQLGDKAGPSCAPTQVSVISSSTSGDSASGAAAGSGTWPRRRAARGWWRRPARWGRPRGRRYREHLWRRPPRLELEQRVPESLVSH